MADRTALSPANQSHPVDPQTQSEQPPHASALTAPTVVEVARERLPFAARFQAVVIVMMAISFFMIAQQWSKTLFQIGLPILVLAAFLQFAFGNIPPASGMKKSLLLLAMTWVIIAIVFTAGVLLAPTLIELGR